jgi:archaetidylinositol phosphate synthase
MLESKIGKYFQPVYDATATQLMKLKLTPNAVTVMAFLTGAASGVFIATGMKVSALIFLLLSGFLDSIDGTLARISKKISETGAYLDLILDRMVEAFVIMGIAYAYPEAGFACLIFLTAVIFNFTTFVVAGAVFENKGKKSMHFSPGIAERAETFIIFSIIVIFPSITIPVLYVFDGIIFLTGMIRFISIIRYQRVLEKTDRRKV